jgi:glycerophosphoryl diester phosphodiesterase
MLTNPTWSWTPCSTSYTRPPPSTLVVEDVHSADEATVDTLRFLVRRIAHASELQGCISVGLLQPLRWTTPIFQGQVRAKGSSMSNAIIKQQGDSPIVADNIWEFRLGAGSFMLGALAGTLVTAAVARLTAKRDATPEPPTPHGWPINFAHRGGAKVVPEDTIEGFREGFAMGAGVVECDIHASAEGAIVVIHDAVVDRTTDGTGPVAERTVPELQRLDAGYRFSTDGGLTFPWRAKGVKIPTLEALYQAFPDAPFNIEIKGHRSGIEEAVFRQIEAAGATDRTLVVSDSRGTISRFR